MAVLEEINEAIQKGRAKIIKELIPKAIEEGLSAKEILEGGMLPAMAVIGDKFSRNEVFVPEVLIAARAMNAGTELLKPLLMQENVESKGKVCIGTVKGDQHDIGKNLVKMMMEGAGLEVIDLGVNVPPQKFVDTAVNENCKVICCSALLTTTMNVMGQIVKACEDAGIRNTVKIMVGGAPVTPEFCEKIGADAYTPDAASAAQKAVEFCA